MQRLKIPFLLLIGCTIGLGLGLYLGWVVLPTEYTNANPAYLADDYQRDYVRMIAAAYAVEGDLAAAQQRLAGLGDEGEAVLTAVMLDAILQPSSDNETRQLVNLAAALGIYSPAMDPYLPAAAEPTP